MNGIVIGFLVFGAWLYLDAFHSWSTKLSTFIEHFIKPRLDCFFQIGNDHHKFLFEKFPDFVKQRWRVFFILLERTSFDVKWSIFELIFNNPFDKIKTFLIFGNHQWESTCLCLEILYYVIQNVSCLRFWDDLVGFYIVKENCWALFGRTLPRIEILENWLQSTFS